MRKRRCYFRSKTSRSLSSVVVLALVVHSHAAEIPSRLAPQSAIELSEIAAQPTDVAWIDEQSLAVTSPVGTWRVFLGDEPRLVALDSSVRSSEIVASDGERVFVSGASVSGYSWFSLASPEDDRTSGSIQRFYPRDAAVLDGEVFYLGWRGRPSGKSEERGVLWKMRDRDLAPEPLHQIEGDDDAVLRWRRSSSPYAGAVVAEPGGTIAVITEAEPGIYRYRPDGELVGKIAGDLDELVLDTVLLVERYAGRDDLRDRYTKLINLQPTVEDLVTTPYGVAILVRKAGRERVAWELWFVEKKGRPRVTLSPGRLGPFGHMRCEGRGTRVACVGSFPVPGDADDLATQATNPRLLIYDIP
jgi:hypothetical protein